MYVWDMRWWHMAKHLIEWLSPLANLITQVEGDGVELGHAMELSVPILNALIPGLSEFGRSDVPQAQGVWVSPFHLYSPLPPTHQMLSRRMDMLYTPTAMLANMLHKAISHGRLHVFIFRKTPKKQIGIHTSFSSPPSHSHPRFNNAN